MQDKGKLTLPTDDFARIKTDEVTVISAASDVPYVIGGDFLFETPVCLIYSEKIKLEGSIKHPGKSIGLFCSTLEVPKDTTIDVSGEAKNPGSSNGGRGEDGSPGGKVWVFVQEATEETMKSLRINANGGDGSSGGDSSASDKIGGNGGNGGTGGSIEVFYGTSIRKTALALGSLINKPWPEQVLGLTRTTPYPEVLPTLNSDQNETVNQYWCLKNSIEGVCDSLDLFRSNQSAAKNRIRIHDYLKAATSPALSTDGFKEVISSLKDAAASLRKIATGSQNSGINPILEKVTKIIDTLGVKVDSELAEVVQEKAWTFADKVSTLERNVGSSCNIGKGVGGQGGTSAGAQKPGRPGDDGKNGTKKATNMRLNGNIHDLEMSQVFAFPDQCQMLLNQADRSFFTNKTADLEKAAIFYRRLVARLSFVAKLDFTRKDSSELAAAYHKVQDTWKLTMLVSTQLQSIHDQAESHLNRLTLGQDMWGHSQTWAPRLSIKHYDEDLKLYLGFLEKEEKTTTGYEDACQNNRDTTTYIKQGITSMRDNEVAVSKKIKWLTGENGPINTAIYKIASFTPNIQRQRKEIQQELTNVKLEVSLDPQTILSALTTLVGSGPNLESLLKSAGAGYDLYKSTTMAKDMKGNNVRKEYIIDQLATCADNLKSLTEAFSTRKNNTIEVDDPGAVKVLTAVGNIQKILQEFKSAIPEVTRQKIDKDLTNYIATVQTRNEAVIEYNSCIQLLAESLSTEEHLQKQIEKLGQEGLGINPSLPAVAFWLRKFRDSLRFQVMQTLNYQSRAIRYWGLQRNPPIFDPMPLGSFHFLSKAQLQLRAAFENCLQQYAKSARFTWPPESDVFGRSRKLTPEEIETLKKNVVHSNSGTHHVAYIRLDPKSDRDTFKDDIDIRLSQVRLWLLGVDMSPDERGRKLLSIQLIHMGEDLIQDNYMNTFQFSHDPVTITFEYDVALVSNIKQAPGKAVFSEQNLQDDHYIGDTSGTNSIAALGPFTTWKLSVKVDSNKNLNMQGLKEAYLEFRGSSRSISGQ